ncbi:hypothetical protein F442_01529, partial [Phytophthora nicotianae P10297]
MYVVKASKSKADLPTEYIADEVLTTYVPEVGSDATLCLADTNHLVLTLRRFTRSMCALTVAH